MPKECEGWEGFEKWMGDGRGGFKEEGAIAKLKDQQLILYYSFVNSIGSKTFSIRNGLYNALAWIETLDQRN